MPSLIDATNSTRNNGNLHGHESVGLFPQTQAVADALTDAVACGRPLILQGPGVHDVLIDSSGIPVRIAGLVADLIERHDQWGLIGFTPAHGAEVLLENPAGNRLPPLPTTEHEPDEVLRRLSTATTRGFAVIIDNADDLFGAAQNSLSNHPSDRVARELFQSHGLEAAPLETRAPLIAIDRSGNLTEAIANRGGRSMIRAIGLPDRATLIKTTELIQSRAETDTHEFAPLADTVEAIAAAARGLGNDDLVDASKRCAVRGNMLSAAEVLRIKATELPQRSMGVLRLHNTSELPSIAEIPHLTRFLDQLKGSSHWPLGMCLSGPPGTGKSLSATLIAKQLGLPLVSLNLVMNSLVGESERRMHAALDRMYLGQRSEGGSSDGGTSERVQAALFSFIDPRLAGDILFVGTSNRPDLMDAASRDRFKTAIPILLPTATERASILCALASRAGMPLRNPSEASAPSTRPELATVTARDLHDLVAKACRLAGRSEFLDVDFLHAALDRTIPRDETRTSELMTLHAVRLCADLDLLPWKTGPQFDGDLPPFIDPIIDAQGHPIRSAIDNRLNELTGRG
jgi:ATPase family associated with various cellular activities (AAA)